MVDVNDELETLLAAMHDDVGMGFNRDVAVDKRSVSMVSPTGKQVIWLMLLLELAGRISTPY